jgi:uncharacterized membrane protein
MMKLTLSVFVAAVFGCLALGSVCWQLGLIVFAVVFVVCLLVLCLYGWLASVRAHRNMVKNHNTAVGEGDD